MSSIRCRFDNGNCRRFTIPGTDYCPIHLPREPVVYCQHRNFDNFMCGRYTLPGTSLCPFHSPNGNQCQFELSNYSVFGQGYCLEPVVPQSPFCIHHR